MRTAAADIEQNGAKHIDCSSARNRNVFEARYDRFRCLQGKTQNRNVLCASKKFYSVFVAAQYTLRFRVWSAPTEVTVNDAFACIYGCSCRTAGEAPLLPQTIPIFGIQNQGTRSSSKKNNKFTTKLQN